MDDHVQLDTVCPNNHNLTLNFRRDGFEAALQTGTFASSLQYVPGELVAIQLGYYEATTKVFLGRVARTANG